MVDRLFKTSQTLKGGAPLKLAVNITGSPRPDVTWLLNDKPVDDVTAILVDKSEGASSLEVLRLSRDLSGCFKVIAQNDIGVDSLQFDIDVKGLSSSSSDEIFDVHVGCVRLWRIHQFYQLKLSYPFLYRQAVSAGERACTRTSS